MSPTNCDCHPLDPHDCTLGDGMDTTKVLDLEIDLIPPADDRDEWDEEPEPEDLYPEDDPGIDHEMYADVDPETGEPLVDGEGLQYVQPRLPI